MIIRDMFADDINRKINGVIKVDQAADDVIEQELNEYVITRELKKHFITFFNYYGDAFDQPTSDMGVWISGFFGSGKSHFLKMLSYLLENKEVKGIRSVERFRKKFEDDLATFMLIDRATKGTTETILFNIDIEGFSNKDKTAVLRVFAKMFYNHLGFYGENLKVAMMERYIDQQGKTEEFRRVFAEKKGKSWLEMRRAFAFNGKFIIPTLMEVLDMSEDDAKAWFNDKTATEISIAQLVEDMKAYVDTKPANFRLLFMIDEVGQYVGTDTDMLLNLQSLTEKIGSECEGKIWVICTGQEAIDEIIKVRADEFSRIQARFKTRLSLSSSSVDEVIQKRILKKKPEAAKDLEGVYEQNDSVLRNLFSFSGSILDIKGYSGPREFTENFPFVPYQFIIMQKVFAEIRKHGNSGKHLYHLALLNSKVAMEILGYLAPTINYGPEQINRIPIVYSNEDEVNQLTKWNILLSQTDWDSFETSWDFQRHPLLRKVPTIAEAFDQWQAECDDRFNQLKANEEELNRIFIDIYGLQDELIPEVEDKDVTVRKADLGRDIRSFISYAVGCMFGRYSLDVDGLAYAGGEWDASKYASFAADKDNIIPICDDEYFEDDIVGLFVEFVKTVYGADTLDENLKFIADALGGKGQPKDVIRNYFLSDFYSDHCKIYQKRPIYWLFDSGKKNGFKALIYMHRYQPDTIARIRTDYVHEQQARYRTAIVDLEQRIANASAGERVKLNKKLTTLQAQDTEIRTYEEKIHHLADQMISIDLDDGVKKNYAIFQDVLAKIK